ncbi:MAG: MBL fold metallo-hydrolase [Anaerolineales bacterium]|nr:MBL fold metallo-hydrolase [Anaerolineales bacterium]
MDYIRIPLVLRTFQLATYVPLDPEEAAVRQIIRLGYQPEDVHHIILTHMHFDHCGGLPDFPDAIVHVFRKELEAFNGLYRHWMDLAYVRRHAAHSPKFELYDPGEEQWMGFDAVRIRVEPEMYLIPLHGHTVGHCGVVIRSETGWVFHLGDAAPAGFDRSFPAWMEQAVLGPHLVRLDDFRLSHPEIKISTGHMLLE